MPSVFTLYLRAMKKHRLAIFASGQGTNALNIMTYFKGHSLIEVSTVVTNNPHAGVVKHASDFGISVEIITNEQASDAAYLMFICQKESVDLIILAGYLRMIPREFTIAFDQRIINIHPSLLPKFGGKGMYGDHVHRAVIAAGEGESGITVHYVNEEYDKGEVIGQATCQISPYETLESLKAKIASLERDVFPKLIEQTILKKDA